MYKEALEDFMALKKDLSPEELDKVAREMLKSAGDLEDSEEDSDKKKDGAPEKDEDGNTPILSNKTTKDTVAPAESDDDTEGAKQRSANATPSDNSDQKDTENKNNQDALKQDQDDKENEDSKRAAEMILGEMGKEAGAKQFAEDVAGTTRNKAISKLKSGELEDIGIRTIHTGTEDSDNIFKRFKGNHGERVRQADDVTKKARIKAGAGAGTGVTVGTAFAVKKHNEQKSASEILNDLCAEKLAETREKTASEILDELVFDKRTEGMSDTEKVAFMVVGSESLKKN